MSAAAPVYYAQPSSPLGPLLICGDRDGVCRLTLQSGCTPGQLEAGWQALPRRESDHPVAMAARELDEYFAGRRRDFSVPVRPLGTPFQERVWRELVKIPYGVTISYGELARRVGRPGAARAVGSANGKNPVPLLIPCHRVIRAGGALGGFSCGLQFKERLLALEGCLLSFG